MKNRIFTNSLRTIKKMFPRFLSLLIISFLGTFAFVGLQSTAPNMLDTLDVYLDDANIYDIKIMSTLGLTDDDLNSLKEIEGVKEVESSYSKDVLMVVNESEYVVNISSIPQVINTIKLLSGDLPKNNNEIVVEENLLIKNNLKIGDTLSFVDDSFLENDLIIVGSVNSNYYFNNVDLSQNRGTTSIGAGTINYYSFVLPSLFNQEYYSSIYLTVNNAKEKITSSKEYLDIIDKVIKKINDIKEERELARYEYVSSTANEAIEKINKELEEYKNILNQTKEQLDQTILELNSFKESLDNTIEEYNNTLLTLGIEEDKIDSRILELQNIISSIDQLDENYQKYQSELEILEELKNTKEYIESQRKVYQSNLEKYNENYSNYENSVRLYEINRLIALEKIKEIESSIEKIPESIWLIMDRSDYLTYTEYIEDTGSISNLAKIFPIIFFAVAVLISLVSMNRMVEDDRTEIGTLKSMGFSNKHIIIKYLFFAFLATIIGSISGSILGSIIIPSLIFSIYTLLFALPNIYLKIEGLAFILGIGISFICVLGATYYTVIKVLREKPSELMRPKAPKSGRRVFLEKIKFIWTKINFSNKVTIRNLFRYKKRVLVTILGIAGCTSLMMCGFGLKDSIIDIPSQQFGGVFTFDAMVYVNDYNKDDEYIFENDIITSTIELQNINATINGRKATIFVIENESEISTFINLNDYKTKERKNLEYNKVAISQKLASLENIEVGDTIKFNDKNNNIYEYEVSSIVENYIEHYIFMDKDTYELSNQVFNTNTICIQTIELTEEVKENLTKDLLENEKVISISYVSELVERVNNMLKSLDKVVLILIVLASLLSFVVLYNLSNINIQERKRELATLKVLGFYDKEVDSYITKENIILTIIGIIIGLMFGYFLTQFVIATVEIEKGRFMREIKFMSYVYSTALTLMFTLIVNFVTHFLLKKINMIESLKSVE